MSVCPNCQNTVENNAGFCAACGTKLNPVAAAPVAPQSGGLHCPQCKSTQISPINETSIDGALSSSRGSMTATTVSNTHRNYWMCSHCGTKFRSIPNLEEEIVKTKKQVTISTVATIICLILSIFFIVKLMDNPLAVFFFGAITFGFVIATIVCFCLIFAYKSKVKKMVAECEYLKYHCFN